MLIKTVCLFLILYFGNNFCFSQNDLPEVDTPLGRVRGLWKMSMDERKYASFEGIPYAKPPVGDLRFEEPQPATPWSGIWEADTPYTCLQVGMFSSDEVHGSEDCLYLNVYIPADFVNNPKNLDVVVSIHGGAFMVGSGHTLADSRVLMDRDIILVSINYRIGILGFLSTEDDAIPGNYGLKDQVLAIKWVKDNIASFGGNPDSITLVGLSAGAASVHLHYFSPRSKGLFVRGVSQSGTALSPWVIRRNALQRARKLATMAGCPEGGSTKQLKKCLKERPAQNLLKQLKYIFVLKNMPLSPFAPVVEKGSANAFLDKEPYWLLKEGKVLDVPWITSNTADDGLLPAVFFHSDLDKVDENWVEIAPYLLDCNDTIPASKRLTVPKKILDQYLGSGEKITNQNFKKFTKIFTDRYFATPGELAAKLQSEVTNSPVYYYFFNYQRQGELKTIQLFAASKDIEGVGHGEDGIYFYGLFGFYNKFSDEDKRLRNACQDMLYSFATTGKPSFDGTDVWQPTGSKELSYLNVTGPDDIKLQKIENLTPIDFWSGLGLLENEHIIVKDEL